MNNEENQAAHSEVNNGNQEFTAPETQQNQSSGAHQNNADPVSFVRALLGADVVLIPVVTRTKKPALSDWPKITLSDTLSPEYQRELAKGNIGVVLGAASSGLCAIDIDADDQVQPFLDLNPKLAATLRSKGKRGAQLWIRVIGDYPKLTKLKSETGEEWGEWRADGGQSVVHGRHPDGMDYRIMHEGTPLEIQFSDIHWPKDLKLPWVKTDAEIVASEDGEPLSISDRGGVVINQMYFVRKYTLEHCVKYDSVLGDFFQYDPFDGLWKKCSVESIKRQFLQDLGEAARELRIAQLHQKRTDQAANGFVNLLRCMVEDQNIFEHRQNAIHVANGMICLDGEGSLRSFHPDYLSRNQCPYEYDPNAKCPRFLNELLRPALKEEDISLLQRWAGSVLMGRNPAQRFLMLLGTAGGGKSTLMSILERIIGVQNVAQMRTEHLGDRFELYSFVGKTLLTGKDVSADFLMHKAADKLKALVGHDRVDAEKKGSNERIQIIGDFNVGITCNADLNIRLQGDADAWRRRMIVIRYENPPTSKRTPDFAEQLLATEGPGILRWMVDGAIELLYDLESHGNYILSPTQIERINSLMDQSDSVKQFVMECVIKGNGTTVSNEELLAGYYEYCDSKQWTPFPMRDARSELVKQMLAIHKASNRHDINRDGKSVRGFKNVQLSIGGSR